MIIWALDPGKRGAIACGSSLADAVAINMPDNDGEIIALFQTSQERPVVFLEALVKYTGVNMPSSAMASYAGNQAFCRGALKALGYRVVEVGPKEWQKAHGLKRNKGESKTSWKNRLKELAVELFPHLRVTLLNADALLMLHAALRGRLENISKKEVASTSA